MRFVAGNKKGFGPMPRPMKFWEVMSAFRSRQDLLLQVFSSAKWRQDYLGLYQNFDGLVARQDREVLDAFVPTEITREIAAGFEDRFVFEPTNRHLWPFRPGDLDPGGFLHTILCQRGFLETILCRLGLKVPAVDRLLEMTALEVHERFGGWVIEEVQERGCAQITGDT